MLSWIPMSFLLASAVLLIPFGKISDLLGRKRIFLAGNVIVFITFTLRIVSFGNWTDLNACFSGSWRRNDLCNRNGHHYQYISS
jgi:MFS family permease